MIPGKLPNTENPDCYLQSHLFFFIHHLGIFRILFSKSTFPIHLQLGKLCLSSSKCLKKILRGMKSSGPLLYTMHPIGMASGYLFAWNTNQDPEETMRKRLSIIPRHHDNDRSWKIGHRKYAFPSSI